MISLLTIFNPVILGYRGEILKVGDIVQHCDISSKITWKFQGVTKDHLMLEAHGFGSRTCKLPIEHLSKLYR